MSKKLICPICGSTFSSNAAFYSHIAEHEQEEDNVRDVVIQESDDIFDRWEDLMKDIETFNDTYKAHNYGIEIKTEGDNEVRISLVESSDKPKECKGDCGGDCKCKSNKEDVDFSDEFIKLFTDLENALKEHEEKTESFEDFLKKNALKESKKNISAIDGIDISDFDEKVVKPFIEDSNFWNKFFHDPTCIMKSIEEKLDNYVKEKGINPDSPEAMVLLDRAIDAAKNK